MLRNKKYGMGGAVQSFSSPMLAQGMQGGLSGFGTSGLQTFAKGGRMSNVEMGRMKIKDWYKKNFKTDELGDELNPNTTFDDLFSAILNGVNVYSAMGVHDSVVRERLFSKLSKTRGRYENYAYELYMKYGDKPLGSYAKGGEIIDQYEGRTPADIWFNLTKSQRRHLLLDHANIPSGEISMYVGYETNYDDLPHFVKQIVKKHFAEGQYAKGGQIAAIGDSGIITDKNSMFVGKMALITGDLGNMYEVRVGERTTIVKKNGIRIISDEYADGGQIYKLAEKMTDADFEKGYDTLTAKEKESVKSLIRLGDDKKLALATILAEKNNPRKASDDFYRQAYYYAKGGQTSTYEVHLEAVPNRDFDQSSHEANVRVPKLKKSAKSVDEAVAIAKKFIEDNDLGGSNFLPAKLYKNGKQVGFISYNGRVWNSDQSEMKYAEGGKTNPKRIRITLIMDGQKYSYPVAIVNGQVKITDETFKDGVLREYLNKEFNLWLDQAPSDYEEMYYGDESIMSKRGAIEGAMEYVSLTIEDEAPKKTTFNFDEGDIEFDSAYEYERGGSIAVSDDEKRKSLKGNLKIKF